MKTIVKLLILGTCLGSVPVFATLTFCGTAACLGPNDSTGWAQLGEDQTVLTGGFSATSVLGIGLTGAFGGSPANGLVADTCPDVDGTCGWTTSGSGINAADSLVWAFDNGGGAGTGPITLTLSTAVLGVGLWLQADTAPGGTYTGQIQVFNGASPIAFTSGTGIVASNGSGDPVFLGALSSSANITKVVFSLTVCSTCTNLGDFVVDTLSMTDQASAVPEPSSLFLLGSGVLGMGWTLRKRYSRSRRVL